MLSHKRHDFQRNISTKKTPVLILFKTVWNNIFMFIPYIFNNKLFITQGKHKVFPWLQTFITRKQGKTSWFQTFPVFMLYVFSWVIPWRLNFICILKRAISLSHTRPWPPCGSLPFHYLLCKLTYPYPLTLLPIGLSYFQVKPSPLWIPQLFSNLVIIYLLAYEDESITKRRHIQFRRRGITQKKTYNRERIYVHPVHQHSFIH
jgi:hypothetical protein